MHTSHPQQAGRAGLTYKTALHALHYKLTCGFYIHAHTPPNLAWLAGDTRMRSSGQVTRQVSNERTHTPYMQLWVAHLADVCIHWRENVIGGCVSTGVFPRPDYAYTDWSCDSVIISYIIAMSS